MRISDWSSDVCSSDLIELDRALAIGVAAEAITHVSAGFDRHIDLWQKSNGAVHILARQPGVDHRARGEAAIGNEIGSAPEATKLETDTAPFDVGNAERNDTEVFGAVILGSDNDTQIGRAHVGTTVTNAQLV